MIDKNFNFSQIISNYLFCKSVDDFLSNEHGFWDLSNLGLLKSLIENVKLSQKEDHSNIRYKTVFSYLINQYGAFFKNKNEESFFSILTTLFNENLNRFITIDILTELRTLTLKKTSCLMKEKFFEKNEEKIGDLIQKNNFFVQENDLDENYANEKFYDDLREIFENKLEFKKCSILFELSKSYDLNNEKEEENLIKQFQSLNNGIDLLVSPSERKSPKKNASLLQKSRISLAPMENNDEEGSISPVINLPKRMSSAFEEPTASRLRATRISSIEQNTIPQNFSRIEEDSDDELNFNLTPKEKSATKRKETKLDKSTSSPKPTTSKAAINQSNLNTDSDENLRKKNSKKKPVQESSSNEEINEKSIRKRRRSVKKKASYSSLSELSNIDTDSGTETKNNPTKGNKKEITQGKRTKWTENETIYLAIGVELYGKGSWAKILKRFYEHFNGRTSVHLKDKYRNLERSNEIKRFNINKLLINCVIQGLIDLNQNRFNF